MRGKSVFLLQLCVNFVFPLQQVHTKFLHMWGLLCGLSIDVVDCCLKECVKAMEHVIVVEPEDMMSLVIPCKGQWSGLCRGSPFDPGQCRTCDRNNHY